MQVVEDAQFLAAEFPFFVSAEDDLEPLGMHFGSVEEEHVGAEGGIDGEAAVARGLAAAQDGADTRDEFVRVVRLADEIIRARFERLGDVVSNLLLWN